MWGRHEGLSIDKQVQVRIGADAVTVRPMDDQVPGKTSARNRRRGRVTGIDRGETVHTVHVAVDGETVRALVTDESAQRLALSEDTEVWLSWKATATRLVADAVG